MKKTNIFIFAAVYLSCVSFTYTSIQSKEVDSKEVDFAGDRRKSSVPPYGQLSVSSQNINFDAADSWVSIPFDSTGPTSHMGVSITSPAKITVKRAGVYQLNASLYFSAHDPNEGGFNLTTYTFGFSVNNGSITEFAAVYASEPGSFSLNYSNLMQLSKHDKIKFYMKTSAIGFVQYFTNIVTLESGNAYLVRISS